MKTIHEIPTQTCPSCATRIDDTTTVSDKIDKAPKPGDFSICFYCGEVLIFNDDLTLRIALPHEIRSELEGLLHHVQEGIRRNIRNRLLRQ